MKVYEWQEGEILVSTDKSRLKPEAIHSELGQTYWAQGIPYEVVKKAFDHSLVFGAYHQGKQNLLGFGRVISDFATFGYLTDFVVLKEARGQGVGKFLVKCVLAHPELQGFRRLTLATLDAHGLYRPFGFVPTKEPQNWMEIKDDLVYQRRP